MRKNSLAEFVHFGLSYRYLKDVKEGFPYNGEGYVGANIKGILNFLVNNKMKVSTNASSDLRNFWKSCNTKYAEPNATMSDVDANELSRLAGELEIVVTNEALEVCAYFANEKRYNADHLFENAGMIFGMETYANFPNNARSDFDEACKCILLERGTAAAFHLMRGTECLLKHLYFSVVKRGRVSPTMWANMVSHLNERKALDEACKGMLDVFRKGFRNPTAHPEKNYSVDEAQDLLGTTIQIAGLIVAQKGYRQEEPHS